MKGTKVHLEEVYSDKNKELTKLMIIGLGDGTIGRDPIGCMIACAFLINFILDEYLPPTTRAVNLETIISIMREISEPQEEGSKQ